MSVTTKAAVAVPGKASYEIRDIVVDEPREREVLVRVVASGVCHTDATIKAAWLDPAAPPFVLGHEGAGVVEKVGSAVTRVAVGDRVLMSFNSCGRCGACQAAHPAYCDHFNDLNISFTGSVRPDGTSGLSNTDGSPLAGAFFGQSSFSGYPSPRNATSSRSTPPTTTNSPSWRRSAAASRPVPAPCSTNSYPPPATPSRCSAPARWAWAPSWRPGSPPPPR